MSRIFILAFVLFATLFAVNAAPLALVKRETQFLPCPGFPPDVVPLDVKMTPDPVVPGGQETFDIKGTMKKDIVDGDFLVIAFIDANAEQPIGEPLIVDICKSTGVKCPIKAGTEYSTTQQLTAPAKLPSPYVIGIGIGHENEPIACAYTLVTGSVLSAVLSADLDIWNFL
jgi:hypothetical protein